MKLSIVAGEDTAVLAATLARGLECHFSPAAVHTFPDAETSVRIDPAAAAGRVLVVASLDRPNPKILPLLFLAQTLRDYGVKNLVLVAPYLAYMRQDRRFAEGEGVSARYFAGLVSAYFDALITVDPHLHRIQSLDEIYDIPATVVHAAPAVAEWITRCVQAPLLVGPDSESEQWVADLARRAGCPYIVLKKKRRGDRRVEVSIPEVQRWRRHTPVLYDDIIASGRTMLETVAHLLEAGLLAPVCIAVHGLFADGSDRLLREAGAARVVSTNSVRHETNDIDLAPLLVEVLRGLPEV
jgi:ribose-phosphate pyrophosphokinase